MDIYLTHVECINHIPDILYNISCRLNRTAEKTTFLNIEFVLGKDIEYAAGSYVLTMEQGSYSRNFTTMEINYCQLLSSVESQFFLRMAMSEIRRLGNLPLECPLKMNKRYFVRGFTLNAKYLPSYIPDLSFISDININLRDRKGLRLITHGRVARRH
ncbi:hypothetical protein KR084_006104 [Drosophila pseudotakahashii]|nr:hypothetical protein KR084_006104 [Drosophila pseudotakahashii]